MPRNELRTLNPSACPLFMTTPSEQSGGGHVIILSHLTVEGTKVKDGMGVRFWTETQSLGVETTQDIVTKHTQISPFDLPLVMTNVHREASTLSPAACGHPQRCGRGPLRQSELSLDPKKEGLKP